MRISKLFLGLTRYVASLCLMFLGGCLSAEEIASTGSYSLINSGADYSLSFERHGKIYEVARTEALSAAIFVDDFNADSCKDVILFEGTESGFNATVYYCTNNSVEAVISAKNVEFEIDIIDFDNDGDNEFVFFDSVQEFDQAYPYYLFPIVYKNVESAYIRYPVDCIPNAQKFYSRKLNIYISISNKPNFSDVMSQLSNTEQALSCP